jgi:hypothetical protein
MNDGAQKNESRADPAPGNSTCRNKVENPGRIGDAGDGVIGEYENRSDLRSALGGRSERLFAISVGDQANTHVTVGRLVSTLLLTPSQKLRDAEPRCSRWKSALLRGRLLDLVFSGTLRYDMLREQSDPSTESAIRARFVPDSFQFTLTNLISQRFLPTYARAAIAIATHMVG